MRTHKRLIDVLDPSSKTVDADALELPAGVDIEIKLPHRDEVAGPGRQAAWLPASRAGHSLFSTLGYDRYD